MINLQKEYGISPAVGVILLLGITAALATVAGIVLLDIGSGLTQNVTAGTELNETPDGVEVSWTQQGTAEEIYVQVDGETVGTLKRMNDRLVIGADSESNVSLIGVSGSNEDVISSSTTENNTSSSGSTEVKDYNTSTEQITGQLSINPPIGNATVKAVENSAVIDTATTDSDGGFTLNGTEESTVEFEVDGFEYTDSEGTDRKVYATISEDVPDDTKEVIKDIDESKLTTTNIDGETVSLLYPERNNIKQIYTLRQLQGMKGDLTADYKLMNDIDASPTQDWNQLSSPQDQKVGGHQKNTTGEQFTLNYPVSNIVSAKNEDTGNSLNMTIIDSSNGIIELQEDQTDYGDIDVTYELDTTIYKGFNPIGNYGEGENNFTGSLDGNGHTISGIHIQRDTYTGLFGITDSATVSDLTISNSNSEGRYAGLLAGNMTGSGVVQNISLSGTVDSTKDGGSLTPEVRGSTTISNISSTATVDAKDQESGGIIGVLDSNATLQDSVFNGTVTGANSVGGAVGDIKSGTVTNVSVSGTVDSKGSTVGGIAARNQDSINSSTFSGQLNTSDTASSNIGGIAGENQGTINKSVLTSDVSATGEVQFGGIVGDNGNGIVNNSYTTGAITLTNGDSLAEVGGIVGGDGEVNNSYATGSISAPDSNYVGGVMGRFGSQTGSYWDTESTGKSTSANSAVGLTTSEMQGSSAETNMTEFDFTDTWTTTNSYPELQE